jgi:hypothetical protein
LGCGEEGISGLSASGRPKPELTLVPERPRFPLRRFGCIVEGKLSPGMRRAMSPTLQELGIDGRV